ncbi:hypothetical protein D3C78_1451410 [compost metagenome]
MRPHATGQLEAIHVRHVKVREHQRVRYLFQLAQRLMAVSDHVRLDAQLQQHIANHDLIGQMILDDQDAEGPGKSCILSYGV